MRGIRQLDRPPLPMFADGAFPSRVRDPWVTARLGRMLGILVTVCFFTGLISHFHQHPATFLAMPTGPAWGFRLTQGLHVVCGLAAIPVFFAKMWSVYPHLFVWPPVRSVAHAAERASVLLLIGATITQLLTGVMNLAHIYLWPFFFPAGHYAIGWLLAGSVVLHLAIKWPTIVGALSRRRRAATVPGEEAADPDDATTQESGISRRGVIVAAAAGAGLVALTTAGQSSRLLGPLGLLAPRSPADVPGGLPINRLASSAGVVAEASDPGWRLVVRGKTQLDLSLAELGAMPQVDVVLPIACVEGWSADAAWRGVRLRDVLLRAGIGSDSTVRVSSLERNGLYGAAEVPPAFAQHPSTLLALQLNGAPLSLDHGYPLRLIAPNRPGVLQTKWVSTVEVA